MKRPSWYTDEEPGPRTPSKTDIKRDLTKLQNFSLRLLEISPERLDTLDLDERLREAVQNMRKLSPNARSRQAKYVGKLLRGVDLQPILVELSLGRNPGK